MNAECVKTLRELLRWAEITIEQHEAHRRHSRSLGQMEASGLLPPEIVNARHLLLELEPPPDADQLLKRLRPIKDPIVHEVLSTLDEEKP